MNVLASNALYSAESVVRDRLREYLTEPSSTACDALAGWSVGQADRKLSRRMAAGKQPRYA
jgi:hypothetical protein